MSSNVIISYGTQSTTQSDQCGYDQQEWLTLLQLIATHRPAHLQCEYTTVLIQVGDVMPVRSFPALWEAVTKKKIKEKYGLKVQVIYLVQKYVARISTN